MDMLQILGKTKLLVGTEEVKPEKERMVNGIEFTEIKNQIAYGTFNINTDACEGSPFPCVKGTFEYDANNKTLKMSGKITVEQ